MKNIVLLSAMLFNIATIFAATPQPDCGCGAGRKASNVSFTREGNLSNHREIMKGFEQGKDTVKVIVNLIEPTDFRTKINWKSKQSRTKLRESVKAIQSPVLDILDKSEFKLRHKFENQAGFSGEVTLKGFEKLKSNPNVALIEPVCILEQHLAQGIPLMHADTYRGEYNGQGIAIAICDSGVDYRHPCLGNGNWGSPTDKVIGGWDFGKNDADPIPDTNAHGTCCAGIAAGDLGITGDYIGGVAYNAKIYALKVTPNWLNDPGSADCDDIIAAWDWCVTHQNDDPTHPIMVISTSFGGGRNTSECTGFCWLNLDSYSRAVDAAVAARITVLASSGNDGYCNAINLPACVSNVISVGAVYDANFGFHYPCVKEESCASSTYIETGCPDLENLFSYYYATDSTSQDMVTSYSNNASFLDILAPSNQAHTTDIIGAGGYSAGDYNADFGGTSAACPYAAGAVACLQEAALDLTGDYLTPDQVRATLINTGDNVTDDKVAITKPRINLEKAIQTMMLEIIPDATSHGTIDPSNIVYIKPGDTKTFYAYPDTGYIVDKWYVNGQVAAGSEGQTSYTLSNVQENTFIIVTFKQAPQPASLSIITPTAGDYALGYPMNIGWQSSGLSGNVKIELLLNGTFNYLIEDSVSVSIGHYTWNISYDYISEGNGYTIRITSLSSPISGESEAFSIVDVSTSTDPIEIHNITELQAVSSGQVINGRIYSPTAHYILVSDIDASSVANFVPIGIDEAHYFCGVFDGQYHMITNLNIDRTDEVVGLFKVLMDDGTIKNLTLESGSVRGKGEVGALVGGNGGTVINCHSSARVRTITTGATSKNGGLIGRSQGIVLNSSTYYLNDFSEVRSYADEVGGLVGHNTGTIKWCWSSSRRADAEHMVSVGGIAGANTELIEECYTKFTLETRGESFVGGVVGKNMGTVRNCYNGSQVRGETGENTGGIVGYNNGGIVEKSYNYGLIKYSGFGGLIGRNYGSVLNSFWDTTTSGTSQPMGSGNVGINCHGLPTAEMKQQATYTTTYSANWDFDDIWTIDEGVDYPRLRGAKPSLETPPTGVIASDGQPGKITITWNPVADAEAYRVYRADSSDGVYNAIMPWSKDVLSYEDATAIPDVSFYYKVKAAYTVNGSGESELSIADDGYCIFQLPKPESVSATQNINDYVLVQWDAVAGGYYYNVYCSESEAGTKTSLSGWIDSLAFLDTSAVPGVSYYYWVTASVDSSGTGQSDYAGPAIGQKPPLPNPDINGDGFVNLGDFAILAQEWLATGCDELNEWCNNADIDHSGDVTITDLEAVAENWLTGTPLSSNKIVVGDQAGNLYVVDMQSDIRNEINLDNQSIGKIKVMDIDSDGKLEILAIHQSDVVLDKPAYCLGLQSLNEKWHTAFNCNIASGFDFYGCTIWKGDFNNDGVLELLLPFTESGHEGTTYYIVNGQNGIMDCAISSINNQYNSIYFDPAEEKWKLAAGKSPDAFTHYYYQYDISGCPITDDGNNHSVNMMHRLSIGSSMIDGQPRIWGGWYGRTLYVLDKNCQTLWSASFGGSYEAAGAYAGNLRADGVETLLVGGTYGTNHVRLDAVNLANGNIIWTFDDTTYATWAIHAIGFEDLTNDGIKDVIAVVQHENPGSNRFPQYITLNGNDGSLIWRVTYPAGTKLLHSSVIFADVTEDGEKEILVTRDNLIEARSKTTGNLVKSYTFSASVTTFEVINDGMVWVSINDPGVTGYEPFNGQMSKYETTNAQYCQFLNAALASGDITISGNDVIGASGSNSGADFVGQLYYDGDGPGGTYNGATNGGAARINYSGGVFTVDSGFENHPVTYVSWNGATAFCNYYGFRLPTEWEWQAVADYDGSYTYGCGIGIDNNIANYTGSTHPDGTTVVGSFGNLLGYGYGMCDMAGNVFEQTSSMYSGSNRVIRGGGWDSTVGCYVSYRQESTGDPHPEFGFRVCR